jgi:hypothetical protein
MYGVAEGIENRSVLLRNTGIEFPDIRFRDDHVFGERPVGIDADNFHLLANVGFAGAALQTLAAGNVHFRGYKVPFFDARDFIAESHHLAAELVSGNQRRMNPSLGPSVPFVDVEIGPADGRHLHLDQNVGPAVARNFHFADLRPRRGFRLDHREHLAGYAAGHGSSLVCAEL